MTVVGRSCTSVVPENYLLTGRWIVVPPGIDRPRNRSRAGAGAPHVGYRSALIGLGRSKALPLCSSLHPETARKTTTERPGWLRAMTDRVGSCGLMQGISSMA